MMKPESKGLTTPIPAPINKAVINRYSDEFVKTRRTDAFIQTARALFTDEDAYVSKRKEW
ncbi:MULTISPECIES: hypothetical protein [Priestia]|uniref:hypothetical protein n=1 Tax=Priestia TaxID=2800373 RepID=UPI0022B8C304|nr:MULTISPECIES: hypothetical protein [Priestia]MCZ8495705.1 hypothetical protein [Priestia megaterium]MDG0058335.1 hypothetical protein [Priestia sp. P5]